MFSPLTQALVQSLRVLPGVGPKSAQRMAISLLDKHRDGAKALAHALLEACEHVGRCDKCRTFTEASLCELCSNPRRANGQLCVVEQPADILAIEQSAAYKGRYFVLMGHLSPIDGIGPDDIGVSQLLAQVASEGIEEVILATGTTVEGQATAYYMSEQLAAMHVNVSRIAHGVPLGGDLEYIDGSTLAHALEGRREFK